MARFALTAIPLLFFAVFLTGSSCDGSSGGNGGGGSQFSVTCEDMFGDAPGYLGCADEGDACRFYYAVDDPNGPSSSCDEVCGDLGASCEEQFEEAADGTCNVDSASTCDASAHDAICVCSKPAGFAAIGRWDERFCCEETDACVDDDVRVDVDIISYDPVTGDMVAEMGSWTAAGTLSGTTFSWHAVDTGYDEVGEWEFDGSFTRFDKISCYSYDENSQTVCDASFDGGSGKCVGNGGKDGSASATSCRCSDIP